MQAVEYLSQVRKLDLLIENKRDEERELWALATSMTQTNDGMPHGSGSTDKMASIIQKIIDARERTNAAIDKYVAVKLDVIRHIEMLPQTQYDVLYWLYIKKRDEHSDGKRRYYTWSEAAEGLECSEQNIAIHRRKAIKNLQIILDSEGKKQKLY